jgi:hypothetical protein
MAEEIIVIEVDALPEDPQSGVWYLYENAYYYWDYVEDEFVPDPDRTSPPPGGGGTAEVPPPKPTQHPPR